MGVEELTGQAVVCRLCGHAYPQHDDGGGHCRAHLIGWGSAEHDLPCMCPHFRWIDPAPQPTSYDAPPSPAYG